jgi:hypothetical protein
MAGRMKYVGDAHVRVGSKPEVAAVRRDVCFAPVNGHRQAVSACPKNAKNRRTARALKRCSGKRTTLAVCHLSC